MKSRSKLCRRLFTCLTAFVVAAGCISGIHAFAQSNVIYSDATEIVAGEEARIPISISGNTGLAGFGLYITYDPDVITPVDTDDSEGLIAGKSVNTIGGSLKNIPENTVKVIYASASDITEDGLLFDFICNVDPEQVGTTTLTLDYVAGDTINAEIEEVALTCQEITLDIVNNEYGALPALKLQADSVIAGETAEVSGFLSNAGELSEAEITLTYNEDNYDFADVAAAEGVSCTAGEAAEGSVTFTLTDISSAAADEPLFTVTFKSSDTAYSGEYTFEASASGVVGADSIHIIGCDAVISPSETSDSAVIFSDDELSGSFGEVLTVPVYISNNKGLCGYKLILEYDGTLITPSAVNDSGLMGGNFGYNIDNENQIIVLWNNSLNSTDNGHIFDIEFTVNTEETAVAEIAVGYSQPDTFSYDAAEGKDIDASLVTETISVQLNPAETTATTTTTTTTTDTTTETTTTTTVTETTVSTTATTTSESTGTTEPSATDTSESSSTTTTETTTTATETTVTTSDTDFVGPTDTTASSTTTTSATTTDTEPTADTVTSTTSSATDDTETTEPTTSTTVSTTVTTETTVSTSDPDLVGPTNTTETTTTTSVTTTSDTDTTETSTDTSTTSATGTTETAPTETTVTTVTSVSGTDDTTSSTTASTTVTTSTASTTVSTTVSAEQPELMRGDANMDGNVNLDDAVVVLKYYSMKGASMDVTLLEVNGLEADEALEAALFAAVDIDGDGAISLTDASYILSYYAYKAASLDVTWEQLTG